MVETGMSAQEAAKVLGVNRATFYRKLKNPDTLICIRDVRALTTALRLSAQEATDIFFAPDVA